MTIEELKETAEKLEKLKQIKEEYHQNKSCTANDCSKDTNFNSIFETPDITLQDLEFAINKCRFHFFGGMHESLGMDKCPCECFCESCEMIPSDTVLVKMQELGRQVSKDILPIDWVSK
jgi:hypothetical protein